MDIKIRRVVVKKFPISLSIYKYIRSYYRGLFSRRRVRGFIKTRKEIFIEPGAGNRKGNDGWITIDTTKNCDIFWDLSRGIPFPDDSVNKIYCSHFLEHLTFTEGQVFFKDCMRTLISGGTLSICVPNARLYIEAYMDNRSLDESIYFPHKAAYNHTTKIDYINYTAYMDGDHKYMFDEENIICILKNAGFTHVTTRKFDPSLDLKERDYESIYVEAIK